VGSGDGHGAVISPIANIRERPTVEDLSPTGRHRLEPPGPRRTLVRLSCCVGAFLVVVAMALLTASWAGLTDGPPDALDRIDLPAPSTDSAHPTFARTIDIDATRADRPTEPTPTPAPESVPETPVPAPPPPPAPEAAPPPPAPAPAPVVEPGDACSTEGAHGTTADGRPMTCTARGGKARWRPA
jgi:hypothetical protein